jgi:hypothetical protein
VRCSVAVELTGGFLEFAVFNTDKALVVIRAAVKEGMSVDFFFSRIMIRVMTLLPQTSYVIVDWHTSEAEEHVDEAVAFFTAVAEEFGHLPNVIFEVYSKPIHSSWSEVIKPQGAALLFNLLFFMLLY